MKNLKIAYLFLLVLLVNVSFGQHSIGLAPITPDPVTSTPLTAVDGLDMAYSYDAATNNFLRFPVPAFTPSEVLFNQAFPGFIGTAEYVPFDNYYFVDQSQWDVYKADFVGNTAVHHVDITDPTNSFHTLGGSVTGLTYHKASETFYISVINAAQNSYLYSLDIETGVASYIGQIGTADLIIDIAINTEGELYGVSIINDNLVSISTITGAGTAIGGIGFDANFGQSMDFDDDSGTLYYSAFNNGTFSNQIRTVDLVTGNTTLVIDLGFAQNTAFTIKRYQSIAAVPIPYAYLAGLFVLIAVGIVVRRRFFV